MSRLPSGRRREGRAAGFGWDGRVELSDDEEAVSEASKALMRSFNSASASCSRDVLCSV